MSHFLVHLFLEFCHILEYFIAGLMMGGSGAVGVNNMIAAAHGFHGIEYVAKVTRSHGTKDGAAQQNGFRFTRDDDPASRNIGMLLDKALIL
jgi:hypothetical protein